MGSRFLYEDLLPLMAMVSVECTNVGLNTLFKAASLTGMSYFVFIAYYYAIATLVLAPVPFIFYRGAVSSSIKFPLLYRICVLALIGIVANIARKKGLQYTSTTLSSAMSNLTPAFTFALAVLFRMENLDMRSSSSRAKLIGTIVSISGALVVVFYKGSTIFSTSSPANAFSFHWPLASAKSDWLIGGLLLAIEYLLYALWCILEADILKICPAELIVTFLYALCAAIISAPVCFLAEHNLNAWLLKSDIALVAVFYSGIFGPCYSAIIHAWGLRLKGHVYITMFKPLSIAIAAFMGIVFLGDPLHLGTVIGALVISIGFYAVIWGKANEEIPSEKVPFLQTSIDDV